MQTDPSVQYNIVTPGDANVNNKKKSSKSTVVTIIIIVILLLFLGVSVYLLGTKTSFFNFAAGLNEKSNIPATIVPTASPATTVDTATSSATTIETETTATTVPVAVSTVKPTSTPSSVSIENSYVFASPLSAATGNVEKIRITVYILDGTGSGVSGKTVNLTGVDNLAVSAIQSTTDTTGRAIFDVAAGTSGSYEIGAAIGDTSFIQKVTVVFE